MNQKMKEGSNQLPPLPPTLERLAQVRRPHGIKGAIRAQPMLPGLPKLPRGLKLFREADGACLTVRTEVTASDGTLLIETDELRDRDAAETWRDHYLMGDLTGLPRESGQLLLMDYVGLHAVMPNGESLGTVTDVESYKGQDVIVVNDTLRYPVVDAFIKEVNLARGEVVVTPWEEAE